MSRLRICFLSSMHPATDKRVHYKEALALVRAGFDVTHVVREDGGEEVFDGVKLVRFRGGRSLGQRILQLGRLFAAGRRVSADVYHCNEVDSWFVGILLKWATGARLVFDVHEIYSFVFAERNVPTALRGAVAALFRLIFASMTWCTDRVVLAKSSAGMDYPKAARPKLVLVRNYVDLDMLDDAERDVSATRAASPRRGPCVLLHLGSISRVRGWPQILDALVLMQESDTELRVIGQFGDNSDADFAARVRELGLEERVSFQPWLPYHEVIDAVRNCDVGLIVFQPVMMNFTHALPHKLFDYMLGGLPVVAPDFTVEVGEIVRDSGCGVLVDVTDPAKLAACFDELARDPELRARLARQGLEAVLDRYNWRTEAERLVEMYDALENEVRGRPRRTTGPATETHSSA